MQPGRATERWVFAALVLAVAACAGAPVVDRPRAVADPAIGIGAPRDPAATGPATTGFLTPATTPDATAIIPPAPQEGDARNTADWAVFRATRALQGTERWALAVNDDSYRPADLLKDFSCSVGVELTLENAPTVSRMMMRAAQDAGNAAAAAKEVYKRPRPFLKNQGEICIARSDGLQRSYDYPSGHASAGWVQGLILAELAPDRAGAVLARARAYGESRVVCGVHNYSAVEAGRTNAAGVFAALQGSAEYGALVPSAKAEIAAARATGKAPDAATCAKEAELTKPLRAG
jgi:acid phosphatase (class A)